MKISIVIQYYNRRYQLLNTISSINQSSIKHQAEIIVVDDASIIDHDISDLPEMYPDLNFKIHRFTPEEKWWSCPVIPINKGISMATGDAVILLCGECMFVGDILKDVAEQIHPNKYLVYATLSLNSSDIMKISMMSYDDILTKPFGATAPPGYNGGWYQHSEIRNTGFNFCTAIMREDLSELGGFDERFGWGASHGDDNFLDRIKIKGMDIVSIDLPMTYHQYHEPMLTHPVTDQPVDGALLNITRTEPGYKVHNSFIGNNENNL